MDNKREYEFELVLTNVPELTTEVEDSLYEAGCDDATLSVQFGRMFLSFSREAPSLKDAILSAIRDVKKANIGAEVIRVGVCDLVTQAEIARRLGRARQVVHQYITGQRGPGGFPAPVCSKPPLWAWREVASWLGQNDMIKPEAVREAEQTAIINSALELQQHRKQLDSGLVEEILQVIGS